MMFFGVPAAGFRARSPRSGIAFLIIPLNGVHERDPCRSRGEGRLKKVTWPSVPSKKARSNKRAGGAQGALPALSSLMDLPAFRSSRRSDAAAFAAARERACEAAGSDATDELELGCVVRPRRGSRPSCAPMGCSRRVLARLTKGGLRHMGRTRVPRWAIGSARAGRAATTWASSKSSTPTSDIALEPRARGGAGSSRPSVDVVLVVQQLGGARTVSASRARR